MLYEVITYLPQRARGEYHDIMLFVAPYPEPKDGVFLDSICARHRIMKKSYFTPEAAVKGVIDYAEEYKHKVDLSLSEYINMSDRVEVFMKMLRIFPSYNFV